MLYFRRRFCFGFVPAWGRVFTRAAGDNPFFATGLLSFRWRLLSRAVDF